MSDQTTARGDDVIPNERGAAFGVLSRAAHQAVEAALGGGAQGAMARVERARGVTLKWRDGAVESVQESTSRGLVTRLFCAGRYSVNRTCDLAPAALQGFVASALQMTRLLEPDADRRLPDPALTFKGPEPVLGIHDAGHDELELDERHRWMREAGEAARAVPGAERIISVSCGASDEHAERVQVHSDGFSGRAIETSYGLWASVTVRDDDGGRPMAWCEAASRLHDGLGEPARVGAEAARRALALVGSRKGPTGRFTMIVENRAVASLLNHLIAPLQGQALFQERSFLAGRLGTPVASPLLSLYDDPGLFGGFGSRAFDAEGLAATRRPLIEGGLLRSYLLDTYYARKLGQAPTSGSTSNLIFGAGDLDLDGLLAKAGEGLLVTGFLGGNANPTTGDFSLGLRGFLIEGGRRGGPVSEMNVSGNQLQLWKRLSAVGADPYAYAAARTPSLVFDDVQISGA